MPKANNPPPITAGTGLALMKLMMPPPVEVLVSLAAGASVVGARLASAVVEAVLNATFEDEGSLSLA